MTVRKKHMLMMFADYGICLLLQVLGLFVLSLVQNFFWGPFVYSLLMSGMLFVFHYARTHKAGRRVDAVPSNKEGIIIALPLVLCHLLIISLYAGLLYGIIPGGDAVMKTLYTFPDNAPRVANDIILLDYITPVVRLWFATLIGFMHKATNPLVMLITPIITLLASFCGYAAGRKKLYVSEHFESLAQKVSDKFNE